MLQMSTHRLRVHGEIRNISMLFFLVKKKKKKMLHIESYESLIRLPGCAGGFVPWLGTRVHEDT